MQRLLMILMNLDSLIFNLRAGNFRYPSIREKVITYFSSHFKGKLVENA